MDHDAMLTHVNRLRKFETAILKLFPGGKIPEPTPEQLEQLQSADPAAFHLTPIADMDQSQDQDGKPGAIDPAQIEEALKDIVDRIGRLEPLLAILPQIECMVGEFPAFRDQITADMAQLSGSMAALQATAPGGQGEVSSHEATDVAAEGEQAAPDASAGGQGAA